MFGPIAAVLGLNVYPVTVEFTPVPVNTNPEGLPVNEINPPLLQAVRSELAMVFSNVGNALTVIVIWSLDLHEFELV